MIGSYLHPNTKAMLQAWQRLGKANGTTGAPHSDPMVADHRSLVGLLFVLQRKEHDIWTFRTCGSDIGKLLGRDLIEQNFLSLWNGPDRIMAAGLLSSIEDAGRPGILRARGETLHGKRVELEIPLAPLESPSGRRDRILGLYQHLGGREMLGGRPIYKHQLSLVSTPDRPVERPKLHLVASND